MTSWCLQFSSSTEWWTFQSHADHWYAQCTLCSRPWRSHSYSSWDGYRRACCCAATGALGGLCRKLWPSAVAVLGSSCSWTRLLCPLVQRLGAAQCLVRLWIHALHLPGWLLEEFHDFLRDWVSRLLRSILRPGRHVVDKAVACVFFWFCWF